MDNWKCSLTRTKSNYWIWQCCIKNLKILKKKTRNLELLSGLFYFSFIHGWEMMMDEGHDNKDEDHLASSLLHGHSHILNYCLNSLVPLGFCCPSPVIPNPEWIPMPVPLWKCILAIKCLCPKSQSQLVPI